MQNQETQTYQQKDQMGKNKGKEGNTSSQKSGEKSQSSKTQKKDDDMGGGCSC
jgi:hypothetical protein